MSNKKIELSIYEKLLELPLFQGMCSSDMTWIIDKIRFDFAKFKPGETIIQQNSSCNSIYFLLNGEVEMETVSLNNKYIFYEHIASPSVLEPEVLFGPRTRYTHSFLAISEVGTVSISKSEFWGHLLDYEVFRLNYINMLSAQAQNAQILLWQPTNGSLHDRIIRFFTLHCKKPSGAKRIKIKMEDLASELCETRANVSKELNKLQEENGIVLKRSIIEIPSMQNLYSLLQH